MCWKCPPHIYGCSITICWHISIVLPICLISFVKFRFQRINFVWFVTEQPLIKVAPQKIIKEGLSQVVVEARDTRTSVDPLRNSAVIRLISISTRGMSHRLARSDHKSVTQQFCPINVILQYVRHFYSDRHTGH